VKAEEYYKGYLVDPALLTKDSHLTQGCVSCHKGNDKAGTKELAHKTMVSRPSDNLKTCSKCHGKITDTYGKSLHYTTIGQRQGVMPRFSKAELKVFDNQVFEKSCRSCHASCGGCHVKSPAISGISSGLIQGHKFIKKDEGKTCAFCHGGRVYPEFTGEYGGTTDVHYQKGMICLDCHKKKELHGDGHKYLTKQDVKDRPACTNCHSTIKSENPLTKTAHSVHKGKVSCYGCHSGGQYRNCYNCHEGTGAESRPDFMLGNNPRNLKEVTTLRVVPTVRDSFAKSGLHMKNFDVLPNYWNTPVHNIRKRTDRTRSCDSCHVDRTGFLTREILLKDGSKANEKLIRAPKPLSK
jgi:thiosulfate/3-mercaptopyruvate sulfurtransferase